MLRELPALGPLCAQTVVGDLSGLLRGTGLWQSFVVWHLGSVPDELQRGLNGFLARHLPFEASLATIQRYEPAHIARCELVLLV